MIAHDFNELWSAYEPIIAGVANEYGAKGHTYGASHEDFKHEFACWMLERQMKLSVKYAEMDDPERFGKYLARCLRNEGNDYLIDIRDQAGGQPRHGAYFYSQAEIKALLPIVLDEDKWLEQPDGGGSIPATGGNWITTLADVSRAFSQLHQEDQLLLTCYHLDRTPNKAMARMFDISEQTMSYRHTQAIKRLLTLLGGEKPKPMRGDVPGDPWRGRRAINNSRALAMTRNSYEEGE